MGDGRGRRWCGGDGRNEEEEGVEGIRFVRMMNGMKREEIWKENLGKI